MAHFEIIEANDWHFYWKMLKMCRLGRDFTRSLVEAFYQTKNFLLFHTFIDWNLIIFFILCGMITAKSHCQWSCQMLDDIHLIYDVNRNIEANILMHLIHMGAEVQKIFLLMDTQHNAFECVYLCVISAMFRM